MRWGAKPLICFGLVQCLEMEACLKQPFLFEIFLKWKVHADGQASPLCSRSVGLTSTGHWVYWTDVGWSERFSVQFVVTYSCHTWLQLMSLDIGERALLLLLSRFCFVASIVKVLFCCLYCEGFVSLPILWRFCFVAYIVKVLFRCFYCEGFVSMLLLWRFCFGFHHSFVPLLYFSVWEKHGHH